MSWQLLRGRCYRLWDLELKWTVVFFWDNFLGLLAYSGFFNALNTGQGLETPAK